MAGFGVREKVEGVEQLIKKLDSISSKLRKKTLKKAITEATRNVKNAAKARAPRRTRADIPKHLNYKGGQLRKSLAHKIKVYEGAVVGVVGARKNFRLQIGETVKDGKPVFVNPVKYLHLVELGTKRGVTGSRFLREALRTNLPAVRQRIVEALEAAVKEAPRGN